MENDEMTIDDLAKSGYIWVYQKNFGVPSQLSPTLLKSALHKPTAQELRYVQETCPDRVLMVGEREAPDQ